MADLERSTERLAALVLGADALAERRRRPSRGTASVEREQRLARLQWAVSAGRAELQRLAATDDTAGAGGR